MAKQEKITVKILAHPGAPADQHENSGVQTSEGDKFHGEVVELPEDEARLLIGAKRAEEQKKPEAKPKKTA